MPLLFLAGIQLLRLVCSTCCFNNGSALARRRCCRAAAAVVCAGCLIIAPLTAFESALADKDNDVTIDERPADRPTEGLAAATGCLRGIVQPRIDRERDAPSAAPAVMDELGGFVDPGSGGATEPGGGAADLNIPFRRCAGDDDDDDDRGAGRALLERGTSSIRAPPRAIPPFDFFSFAFFFWVDFPPPVNVVLLRFAPGTAGGGRFVDLTLLSTRSSISRWNTAGLKYAIIIRFVFVFQFFVLTIEGGREGLRSPKSTMDEQKYSELWPVYAHNWPNVVNSCNAIIEVGRACTRNHHCVREGV